MVISTSRVSAVINRQVTRSEVNLYEFRRLVTYNWTGSPLRGLIVMVQDKEVDYSIASKLLAPG